MGVCYVNEQLWLLQSCVLFITWPFLHHYSWMEKKKAVERFNVKATVCNFSPQGRKGNSKFPPQHLSLTLMSCLPWNSISPAAKITDIPPRCHGAPEKQMPNRGKGGNKQCWCSVCCWIDFVWCKTRSTRCFAAVVVVDVTHLDRNNLSADYTNKKQNLNVQNIIEKSDKQEDLHLNTQGHWRMHAAYGSLAD